MTSLFVNDFKDRKRQVRHYMAVVLNVERSVKLGSPSQARERRLLTLRAGAFLLLYNLVEASIRNAIEAIHDEITTTDIQFGALTQELRSEIIKRFKQGAKPEVHHTMQNLPSTFVSVAFDQGVSMSGNVDAKYIRELSKIYGFSIVTDKNLTWDGADLLKIKSNRNELAHGRKTFEEVGRDYSGRDLLDLTRRSVVYIEKILDNITDYISGKGYLHKLAHAKPRAEGRPLPLYRKSGERAQKSRFR